jgi:hypothetical protein
MLGALLRPKSFAGLFGAAPSVALATLGIAVHRVAGSLADRRLWAPNPRRKSDVTPIRFSPSSLEGRWYEYLIRFALGGAATVFTGLVSSCDGAFVGGLFLALPAIFCAGATLIEKHEIRRKREAGLAGERRGQLAVAVDPAGAALGMLVFAVVFSMVVIHGSLPAAFAGASLAWLTIAVVAWYVRRKMRSVQTVEQTGVSANSRSRYD